MCFPYTNRFPSPSPPVALVEVLRRHGKSGKRNASKRPIPLFQQAFPQFAQVERSGCFSPHFSKKVRFCCSPFFACTINIITFAKSKPIDNDKYSLIK